MKTYTITLTEEERSALLHMIEKGWDYLKDSDYFYEEEASEKRYSEAWYKLRFTDPNEQAHT